MRFFIYFHFYIVSLGDSVQTFNMGTTIWARNDSISFYVHDMGYVKWKIENTVNEHIQQVRENAYIVNAVYFASFEGVIAIIHIDSPDAEIRILTGSVPFIIKLTY